MKRAALALLLLCGAAALALDWAAVASVRIPAGEVASVAVHGVQVWQRPIEIEYIEATGTQSINTGVVLTPAHRIEADFEFTQVSTKQQRVFEQYDRSGHLFVALYINGAGNIGYAWSQTAGDWKSVSKAISAARRKYVLDGPNRLLQVGATTATLPLVENTGPGEATVTLGSKDTSGVKPTYGKWYSAKIYNGDVLVRDFIPVRIGRTGYLYDRVSDALFGNAGTGAFLLGPDKE